MELELEQVREAARALSKRGRVTAKQLADGRDLERKREHQSKLDALLSTRLSGTGCRDMSAVRPPPLSLPVTAVIDQESMALVPSPQEIEGPPSTRSCSDYRQTGAGIQSQLADLVQQSRVYRHALGADTQSPQDEGSNAVAMQVVRGQLSASACSGSVQSTRSTETKESGEGTLHLRELTHASLAATASMSQQLATTLHELHELRIQLQVAVDYRASLDSQLATAEASKRALLSELEQVARALSIAAAERDAAEEKAAAIQAAMNIQQRVHKDQIAILREENRRLVLQKDADIEDARRDARSDILLFGVMQAASAGADLSAGRDGISRSHDGISRGISSKLGLSTIGQKRTPGTGSSYVRAGATEQTESVASQPHLEQRNEELRQRLVAAEANVARERAKADQWLSTIGSLREELAQAHRRIAVLGSTEHTSAA